MSGRLPAGLSPAAGFLDFSDAPTIASVLFLVEDLVEHTYER